MFDTGHAEPVAGCNIIYAPRGQAGEYAPLATNPYRGCGNGCAYCLAPDTLIQMADGSTARLADVKIGDDLIGVTKYSRASRAWTYTYASSKVLAKIDSTRLAFRITLKNGQSSICSAHHRWLTDHGWRRTNRLTLNDEIRTAPATSGAGSTLRGSSRIVEIEPLGRRIPMFDITTSTENFIANGMISHNCYVPKVLHMERSEFDAGANLRPDYFKNLTKDAIKYQRARSQGQVMLSFTTDGYHPGDTSPTRTTLEVLRDHGLGFCTLTKGGTRALRDIDLFRPDRDAFATTLTFARSEYGARQSAKWERHAATPADRQMALYKFHDAGIFTWVSLEPTIDIDESIRIVHETRDFVDLYKIGRVNYLPMTKTTDWKDYTLRMLDVLHRFNKKHYIKKDLQKYLPDNYPNPLRIPQHH
jgi:DNA repair photolyase